jgi:GrpB-like predicted nucleotidyltransferase (UPF0157 family)
MITPQQQKWIDHLSDKDRIVIKPYDSTTPEKFEAVKTKIKNSLGESIDVRHCGATSLGISGQDEIDVYIPVAPSKFNKLIPSLTQLFGEPRSHYPLERARFVTIENGKHVDVFLINKDSDGWLNGLKFEKYLKSHPKALEAYRKLKESGNGLSTREYYRRKIEFINQILDLT